MQTFERVQPTESADAADTAYFLGTTVDLGNIEADQTWASPRSELITRAADYRIDSTALAVL